MVTALVARRHDPNAPAARRHRCWSPPTPCPIPRRPDDPPDDTRLVDLSVEVPGTPEEVWEAIATGPGTTCWFTLAEIEEREGGALTLHFSNFGDSQGVVTAWVPPRRFAEEREWAEGAPPWATEILVEARAGGTCVVRLVSGVFRDSAAWTEDIDGSQSGWRAALGNLRLYRTHFPGQPDAQLMAQASVAETQERAWARLAEALGLRPAALGEPTGTSAPGAPAIAGVVERTGAYELLLRTGRPGPGLVEAAAWNFGGSTNLSLRGAFYGDEAAALAESERPGWIVWMAERFRRPPSPRWAEARA
jgi:uncharacterized protein YndB with AHSA1/START domain